MSTYLYSKNIISTYLSTNMYKTVQKKTKIRLVPYAKAEKNFQNLVD